MYTYILFALRVHLDILVTDKYLDSLWDPGSTSNSPNTDTHTHTHTHIYIYKIYIYIYTCP